MASGPITHLTADVFIPEVWSDQVQQFRMANLPCVDRMNRSFDPDAKFGNLIKVPNLSEMTARTKATDVDITFEHFTETSTDITINTHTYTAIKIEDLAAKQSKYELMSLYTKQFGYNLGKNADTFVNATFDGYTTTRGTLASGLTEEDLRFAIMKLNQANAPREDRSWFFSPEELSSLRGIDKLVNNDYAIASVTGEKPPMIWGIPVYETTNLEGSEAAGHDNALVQRSANAFVTQLAPKVQSMYNIRSLADETVSHQIYGGRVMRLDHAVTLFAK